jgi:hypothetical protein
MSQKSSLYRPFDRLVEAVKGQPYDTSFTYEELSEIMDIDPRGRGRSVIDRVSNWLLEHENKMLVNDRKKGYHIAHPREHAEEAEKKRQKAGRQIRKGIVITVHVDASELNGAERVYLEGIQMKLFLENNYRQLIDQRKIPPLQGHQAIE